MSLRCAMHIINKCLLFSVTLFSSVFTFITIIHLMKFLSGFSNIKLSHNLSNSTDFEGNSSSYVSKATVDVSLLCIFITQHSSLIPFQEFILRTIQLPVLSRTLLNLGTSLSLQLMMKYWEPIPQYTLWTVGEEQPNHAAFLLIHIISWLLIYVMMISMDVTDLLGLKQVYYFTTGRPEPSVLKSPKLRDLHSKLRHPSLLMFTLIFWCHPNMSFDRLLLASIWTLYMLLVWRPGISDYNYVVKQQSIKKSIF